MSFPSDAAPPSSANLLPDVTLEQLSPAMQAGAARAKWPSLMPVQARAIPYLLAERDVMIQARTGSGKTGAFLLPLLERLDPTSATTQALILVPTRELARQVWQEAETICGQAGLRTVAMYGGVGYGPQIDALKAGAHVVVGTPGRVLDHLLKRSLNLDHLRVLVFDEADRMLSMGFYPDMKRVQRYLPSGPLTVTMFSATFPTYVMRTASEFLRQPEFISLSRDHVHVSDTEHVFYMVPGMDKDRSLVRIIELENPASAIIFCNTKVKVAYVAVVLQRFGYDADALTSDLSQPERERVLERVRKGTLRLLIATDVAARGLDIPDLSHVFMYEPPDELEAYIHRAGRTGRAGATGTAISLVSAVERFELDRIGKRYAIPLHERPVPTDEEVEAVVAQRTIALLEARLRDRDRLQTERSRRFVPLARSLAESEDELALIAMLLDDYYQQAQHAPLPSGDGAPPAPATGPTKAERTSRERSDRERDSGGSDRPRRRGPRR